MEAITFEQPTDGEKAAEAGMSPTAFSLEKNGKGNSSAATRARFDAVQARYERAEQDQAQLTTETLARSDLGKKLLAIVTGADDE